MYALISLPTPSNIISSSTEWTTAFLPEFWTLVYVAVGLMVVGLVVRWIIKNVKGGIRGAFGMRRGRARKGRR